jgi:Replication protein
MAKIGETGGPGQVALLPGESGPATQLLLLPDVPAESGSPMTRLASAASLAGGDGVATSAPIPLSSHTVPCYTGSNRGAAGQSQNDGSDDLARKARRAARADLREVLRGCTVHGPFLDRLAGKWNVNPDGTTVRLGGCGTAIHGMSTIRAKGGIAYFSGTESCKSLLCPMCGPRVRGGRAQEFTQAVERWFGRGPRYDAWFVRLSARNTTDLPLADGVARSAKGFTRLIARRPWRELRKRYGAHYIKVREETHGENGWNVHLQLVIATHSDDSAQVFYDLNYWLRHLWPSVMAKLGYYASPEHSVDIVQVTPGSARGLGAYLAKESAWGIGDELARGDVKLGKLGGRTYEQIVADFGRTGDSHDLALIHEYHDAMYGRRQCSWSEGFRELLHMAPEQPDEELAGEDEEPAGQAEVTDVAVITGRVLYTMLMRRQVASLLDTAERDGLPGVRALVGQLGYPPESVLTPRPELTRKHPPREGGGRVSRTEWIDAGERHHVPIEEVHAIKPVAGCICGSCRPQ